MPPPAKTNADVVRQALIALQNLRPAEAAQYWVPGFHLNCNGKHLDNAASFEMFQERQARILEPQARFVDIFSNGDRVAAWRTASLKTREGTQAPAIVLIDVWRLQDGQILSGMQCWQQQRLYSGDDMPMTLTVQEAAAAEAVRRRLEQLGELDAVQERLSLGWAEEFNGHLDGMPVDLAALRQHWAALQAALKSLHVDVKQLVSQGTAVGACYHLVATKQDGEVAELRIIAVFGIDKAGKIASCDAVSRLVSGSIGDERLATLMPSQ
ncbi:hypothetical protein D9Q98_006421 [Chlorella vulgaris]|uniref:SnoaL-like domain-containing protein n=1 Tax=Chlorella vulgaris TaxID=3077 RepID=A0A9D4TKC0_CHLVU|nr:hypothetical protein D9Q98_006421 [Chlorella vulgaris]